jgi:hypothetical protein
MATCFSLRSLVLLPLLLLLALSPSPSLAAKKPRFGEIKALSKLTREYMRTPKCVAPARGAHLSLTVCRNTERERLLVAAKKKGAAAKAEGTKMSVGVYVEVMDLILALNGTDYIHSEFDRVVTELRERKQQQDQQEEQPGPGQGRKAGKAKTYARSGGGGEAKKYSKADANEVMQVRKVVERKEGKRREREERSGAGATHPLCVRIYPLCVALCVRVTFTVSHCISTLLVLYCSVLCWQGKPHTKVQYSHNTPRIPRHLSPLDAGDGAAEGRRGA